nr:sensor histidine kinase [uncultured Methanolobus sp.]
MLINIGTLRLPARLVLLLLVLSIFFVPLANCELNESHTYRIGVLSVYGEKETSIKRWAPTADYLSRSIPNASFEVVPYDYHSFVTAVNNGEVNFFYGNPLVYAEMERDLSASRIATFQRYWNNSSYLGMGGVIFTTVDRTDINSIDDLNDKTLMAVDENSLGGFLAPMGELHRNGLDYRKDLKELRFGGTHDAVVLSVLSGEADAGTVRTGTLERMQYEGKINISDIKVLGQKEYDDFPLLVSTELYPDWAFATVSSTPDDVSKEVCIALLRIPSNSTMAIALSSSGWLVPADYSPVDDLMRELRYGHYVDYGKVTLKEALLQHWYVLVFVLMFFIVMEIHSRMMAEKIKKEQLEESNKLKDLFTDIMRHDLLNPASVIRGFSDTLYTTEEDEERKEHLKFITDQTDHMITMIGSAAKLAKLESSEQMDFEPLDLGVVLWRIVDSFSPEFARNNITLEYHNGHEYPVKANYVIEDVFANLISNSLKYSPQGTTITVSVEDKDRFWKTMITDEGDGIPDDVKPFVFDRFRRADKKGIKGSGLGLAIVKRIVDIHKGSVGIEDNPAGKGSVFWVMLEKA